MKKLLLFMFCLLPCLLEAQTYEEFLRQRQQEYKDYIDKQNQEFIQFLKEYWKEYPAQAPVVRPKRPEPVKPVLFDKTKQPDKPVEMVISGVKKLPLPETGDASGKTPLQPTLKGNIPTITIPDRPVAKRPPVAGGTVSPLPEKKQPEKKQPENVKPESNKPVNDKPEGNRPESGKPETSNGKLAANGKKPVVSVSPTVTPVPKPATPVITPKPVGTVPETPAVKAPSLAPAGTMRTSGAQIAFYGNKSFVSPSLKNCFSLRDISENSVANAWETLCRKDYKTLVGDCDKLRKAYSLNDWGYVLLAGKVASSLCSGRNEQVLMQMFLLCQSGYKAKVARMDNELILLVSTDGMLYGQSFFTINGERYFMLEREKGGSVYTYNKDFAHASHQISMNITDRQIIEGGIKETEHHSKAYPTVKVMAGVNKGLIDFYKDYPQCEFPVYATAPVSDEVQQSVLPPLQAAVAGKSEKEAANILLNFVQTGFAYQTDNEQFGYEKPFFVDELFYYPACDCEDRSVLFSYLVRTLLKLDVVLLDYPNHIATAVHFNEEVKGDYVMLDGKKYLICDPTFINASIGQAMPQFRNAQVEVIRF